MGRGYWVRKLLNRAAARSAVKGQKSARRGPGRWLYLEALEKRLAPAITFSVANPLPFPAGASGGMMFVVTRSGDTAPAVQVNYATQDGTGHAGIDYTATSGTLSFGPGETMKAVDVPVLSNTMLHPARSFTLALSNPLASAAFGAQATFDSGGTTQSVAEAVAVADLNGDGKPDLVVGNAGGTTTVSVLLNTTAPGATIPSFATQQTFAIGTGNFAVSVAVADLNGDGKPDLVVANSGSNTVSVLLNTMAPGATAPSFAAQKTFATGSHPASVAVADFNGDGRPDLVVANYGSNTVLVLLNTTAAGASTPSFAAQETFAAGSKPGFVAVSDLNGDGRPDLVVADYGSNTVSVLLNMTAPGSTTPSFAAQETFATGITPRSVAVADFNGDGKPDLVVANYGSNTLSVLLNTTAPGASTASFAAQQTFAAAPSSFPTSVAVADFNGDGKPDLVVANYVSSTVSVLLNTTAPGARTASFAAQQTFDAGGAAPAYLAVADLNGDGKPDLAVTDLGSVSVVLNTRVPIMITPGFAPQQTFASGSMPKSVAEVDLNGDGKPDLVVANEGDNTVSVLLNTTAPGASTPAFATQETFATGNAPISVAVADVNGDGRPDLVVANNGSGTVSVLLNTTAPGATTPSFALQQTFATGTNPRSVAVADFNGDGKFDLVVANDGSGTVSMLLNTTAPGATTLSFANQQTFTTGNGPISVAVADVNGDGRPDLVVANLGSNTVSVLLNTTVPGATSPSFIPQQTFATGTNPRSVAVADFSGDGKPDLVVAKVGSNTVSVLLNTTATGGTTASFALQQTFAAGAPDSVAVADFNGDGKPDVVVADFNSDTVSVLLNRTAAGATTPSFATQGTFTTGSEPFSVAVADVNGDGKPDLAVANQISNTVSVLLSNIAPFAISGSPATGTIVDVLIATGAGAGGSPQVRVFDAGGTQIASFLAFDPFFQGGVRTAVGDVNGDGVPDLIVAAGRGGGPDVKIIDGTKLAMVDSNGEIDHAALLGEFYAYSPFFNGGVFVAFGLSHGLPEIITGVGGGGGPHVKVIAGTKINQLQSNGQIADSALVAQFYAFSPFFNGGVRVAAADLNSDGVLDIVTGAGPGGGPLVKAINGTKLGQLQNNAEISDAALIGQFYAYTPTAAPSGGVYVAATDIGGRPIIITGDGSVSSGAVDGPRVKIIDATKLNLLDSNAEPTGDALLGNFFAYDPAFGGGVSVGAADLNGDGVADIITGAGPGGGPHVKAVNGTQLTNLQPNGEVANTALLDSFFAFIATSNGGVFVGGGA
jgi:hypothetical protein